MADELAIDLDTLIDKLPDKLKPWAREFAPALMAMTFSDAVAWINRVGRGDIEGAYRAIISKMPADEFTASREKVIAETTELVAENARRMSITKRAREEIVWTLLRILFVMVGL